MRAFIDLVAIFAIVCLQQFDASAIAKESRPTFNTCPIDRICDYRTICSFVNYEHCFDHPFSHRGAYCLDGCKQVGICRSQGDCRNGICAKEDSKGFCWMTDSVLYDSFIKHPSTCLTDEGCPESKRCSSENSKICYRPTYGTRQGKKLCLGGCTPVKSCKSDGDCPDGQMCYIKDSKGLCALKQKEFFKHIIEEIIKIKDEEK